MFLKLAPPSSGEQGVHETESHSYHPALNARNKGAYPLIHFSIFITCQTDQ